MTVIWESDGNAFYGSVTGPAGEDQWRLVVERLGDQWDWSVWCSGNEAVAVCGIAATRHGAMKDAEAATQN
jgi:hypothetical protein